MEDNKMKEKSNGKTGIITYYQSDNYGANLQAFAMLLLFNDSALVKYREKTISQRNYQKLMVFLKNSDTLMQRFSVVINSIYTKICFCLFRRKYLKFCNIEECTSIILGSDQIWNIDINKGDLFFFQNVSDARTFAFAASFGYDSFPNSYVKKTYPLFKRMDIISVRELDGKAILKNQFNIDSEIVLDPVLLIPIESWKNIFKLKKKSVKNKGLIFYQREINIPSLDLIKSKYPGITFEIYSNSPIKYANAKKTRCGKVKNWLSHIYNASIILTTSYHAIIFAILFHRQFIFAKFRNNRYSSRITSLFILLNISYQVVEISNNEDWIIPSLNFSDIDKELESLRVQSHSLIKSIKGRLI